MLGFFSLLAQSHEIKIITYHTHAPFLINSSEGLTYDLAEYLSERTNYEFTVEPMSRPRLDELLDQEIEAIIPWVSPAWFKDSVESKYIWTQEAIMEDSIAYVSSSSKPLSYGDVDDLENLTFGGLKGHNYVNIDDIVKQGRLVRLNSDNHFENYRKIIQSRIDFTITPTSGTQYLIKENNLFDQLYVSIDLNSIYERKILVANRDKDLLNALDVVIPEMDDDPIWNIIMSKYR